MSEKLDMASPDIVSQNIQNIAQLFPNCVTEAENGLAIDFDLLKQELSDHIVDGLKERYRLEWPGKREAVVTANLPTNKTLRPVREDSVDFDNTENLYIEGDNLEVLKLLQESYLGKIKMIYIDPPYNTGKDFVYKDNFTGDKEEHSEDSGFKDELQNRLVQNPDTSGRYHSDWLTMMYPRLKLARNLLTDDGVIFISIDDNESHNLVKLCDEIFGETNFVSELIIITGANQAGEGVNIQKNTEKCLVYAKSIEKCIITRVDKTNGSFRNLNDAPTPLETRKDMGYTVYYNPKTEDFIPKFDYDKEKIDLNKEELVYIDDEDLIKNGYVTIRPGIRNKKLHRWRWGIDTFEQRRSEIVIEEFNNHYRVGFIQDGFNPPKNYHNFGGGTSELKIYFNDTQVFDYPKSFKYIKYLIEIGTSEYENIILDFFSGSRTTAHSAMELMSDKKLKYILVQIPENLDDNLKSASNDGKKIIQNGIDFLDSINKPHLITELAKERIRRAAQKIKKETGKEIDYGFRVYRLDSSNMQDVYYTPSQYEQKDLELFADNVKPGRTADDLVAQIMLDWGLPLSLKIEKTKIAGKVVHKIDEDALFCCFDSGIAEDFAKEVAAYKPMRIVFSDSSFASDTAKENVKQLLKQLSPETEMKVL